MVAREILTLVDVGILALAGALVLLRRVEGRTDSLAAAIGTAAFIANRVAVLAGGGAWTGVLEIIAIWFWITAASMEEGRAHVQLVIGAFFVLVSAIFMGPLFGPLSKSMGTFYWFFYRLLLMCSVLYGLLYVVMSRMSGRHYLIQCFSFFLIASGASTVWYFFNTGNPEGFSITVISVAYWFAFASMIMYSESLNSMKLKDEMSESDRKSRFFNASTEVIRRLQAMPSHGGPERVFFNSAQVLAHALKEELGYGKIYGGILGGGIEKNRFEDLLGGYARKLVHTELELPAALVSEASEKNSPILVRNAETDRRIGDSSFSDIDLNSFVLLPICIDEEAGIALLIGGRPDSRPMDEFDEENLGRIAFMVSSYLTGMEFSTVEKELPPENEEQIWEAPKHKPLKEIIEEKSAGSDRSGAFFSVAMFLPDEKTMESDGQLEEGRLVKAVEEAAKSEVKRGDPWFCSAFEGGAVIVYDVMSGEAAGAYSESILKNINSKSAKSSNSSYTVSAAYSLYPFDFAGSGDILDRLKETLSAKGKAPKRLVRVRTK